MATRNPATKPLTKTRHERDTEQLRRVLVHYRALFDELLEVAPDKRAAEPSRADAVMH
jgi:hypothetical protein